MVCHGLPGRFAYRIFQAQFDHGGGHFPQGVQRLPGQHQLGRVDVPQHHTGTGLQHALRCGQANALGAAGDDGDAAIQVHLIHLDSPFNV